MTDADGSVSRATSSAPSSTSRGCRRRSPTAIRSPPSIRRRARPTAQIEMHRQFLISQIAEQRAKLSELDRQQSAEGRRASDRCRQHRQARRRPSRCCRSGSTSANTSPTRTRLEAHLSRRAAGSRRPAAGSRRAAEQAAARPMRPLAALKETRDTDRRGISPHASSTNSSKAEQKAAGLAQDVIKASERTKLQDA